MSISVSKNAENETNFVFLRIVNADERRRDMVSLKSDGFRFVPLFITTIFFIVMGTILFTRMKGFLEWKKNNEA
ncbi:hypothetical protein BA724_06795 [Domibacillus iocasae]|uniref:Uncharacterized protein n=1 Tax=Domibacillus iocasae TaxID=1714016 RepID=A0A1E7DPN4_9BACI|nr:hypothetical protein BA724_06795 [Domibacillus iocasae]